MKLLISLALCLGAVFASAQVFDDSSAAEMEKIEWLLGDWKGTMKFSGMGPEATEDEATISVTKCLGGNYIQGVHKSKLPFGEMEGLNLISFDPREKKFKAHWFDSYSAGAMEMSGDLEGNRLVMTSKPMLTAPGEPEGVFRATWTKKSETEVDFLLEFRPVTAEEWEKAIEGTYHKSSARL
jgi:hypothetical protein